MHVTTRNLVTYPSNHRVQRLECSGSDSSLFESLKMKILLLLFLGVLVGIKAEGDEGIIPGYGLPLLRGIGQEDLRNVNFSSSFIRSLIIPSYVEHVLDLMGNGSSQDVPGWNWLVHNVKNDQCKGHIEEWLLRVMSWVAGEDYTDKDVWVLHMLDAWGKIPEGFLSGHVNSLGDFDECVDISVSDMEIKSVEYPNSRRNLEGRYCNTFMTPYSDARFKHYWDEGFPVPITPSPKGKGVEVKKAVTPKELFEMIFKHPYGVKVFPSLGVCFPSACERQDIERVLMNVVYILLTAAQGGTPPTQGGLWPGVEYCYVGEKAPLDAGDISVIALLSVIVTICLAATVLDVHLNRGNDKPVKGGIAYQSLMSFSLFTNIPKWLSTRPTADDLGCLHGIRFLSTAWVILAHTWFVIIYIPYWNLADVKLLQEKWAIMTMMNATVAVDTFFVISGLLVAYNVLKMLHKTKGKLNVPMFYVHRYLRLTPVYMVLVGVMATLVPYTGRGPYWFIMDRWGEICETNWWTNMVYVNNFVNTSWLCQGEAWYLANDMQFYIVSPLLLLPLYHWQTIGLILLGVATVLSCVAPILMVHFMETTPTTIATKLGLEEVNTWFTDIYIKPHARIQTYFVGMWLGLLLFKTKGKRVKLPILVVLLFWALSTATCLVILYGIQEWFDPNYEIPKAAGLMYAGLSRFAWGVAVAWVIFACVKGYGGLINDFLSWKVFMPLGRLCYCAFLVSLHLQMILHVSMKQPIGYSGYTMTNFFFAHMVMTFTVAFFFTLMVETPFMQLEKILLEGGGRGRGNAPKPGVVSGLPGNGNSGEEPRQGIFYSANSPPVINGNSTPKQE